MRPFSRWAWIPSAGVPRNICRTPQPLSVEEWDRQQQLHHGINSDGLAREQQRHPEIPNYQTYTTRFQSTTIQCVVYLCDISTKRNGSLVPVKLHRTVFDMVHGLAHPSIKSTVKLNNSKFVRNTIHNQHVALHTFTSTW